MTACTISVDDFAQVCRDPGNVDLIDVRTPAEFREVHLSAARNIPLAQLDPVAVMKERAGKGEHPLYVICQSGARGRQACEMFCSSGYPDVMNVEGGTAACVAAGLSVVRGAKTISLERQVRIAAGALVLLGAALGWFVHPAFVGLSAFVGAGLLFAGITDTCGMAAVLAQMPWNHCSQSPTKGSI